MKDGISIVMAYYNRKKLLINTLNSISRSLLSPELFEIIIVDDNSSEEHQLYDIKERFNHLNINIIEIKAKQKDWINSSITYNIGFNHIQFNRVIIQNPECFHTGDILLYTYDNLKSNDYIAYGAYSLKYDDDINNFNIKDIPINMRGENGWMNHSTIWPVYYHFCAAIYYNNILKLNGFDERYKDGIAFDDNELVERIKRCGLNMKIVDYPFVLHQYHFTDKYHLSSLIPDDEKNKKMELFIKNKELFENITLKENIYTAPNNKYFKK
jgi:GT2 family glycosyltransferase